MRIGSDKDVAEILGISTVRLKARISAGAPVPPFMKVPGCKFRRWDLDSVEQWMATFTVGVIADVTRRRGRPRKTAALPIS